MSNDEIISTNYTMFKYNVDSDYEAVKLIGGEANKYRPKQI